MTTPQYQVLDFVEDDAKAIMFTMVGSDGVTPVNITGYTLVLQIRKNQKDGVTPSGDVLSKTASITSGPAGQAQWAFATGDLNFTGICDTQIKVTDAGGNTYRVRGMALHIWPRWAT